MCSAAPLLVKAVDFNVAERFFSHMKIKQVFTTYQALKLIRVSFLRAFTGWQCFYSLKLYFILKRICIFLKWSFCNFIVNIFPRYCYCINACTLGRNFKIILVEQFVIIVKWKTTPNCAQWCSIQYLPTLQCFLVLSVVWII